MEGRLVEPTRMRAAIAKRMQASKAEAPHFYVQADILVDKLREDLSAINSADSGTHVTMTAALAWGCVHALKAERRFNSVWADGGLLEVDQINLGLAIALEEGLVAPAVIDVGELNLVELAAAIDDVKARAHAQRLRPVEMTDGTFTLSNLGAFPVTAFSAIITPPQVATLATARAIERCILRDGEPTVVTTISVTLSADHRAVDGVDAARWLQTFKQVLEAGIPSLEVTACVPKQEVVRR